MMWPASPFRRISRVVAMPIANRNKVVTSKTDGNEENASGVGKYIATISKIADKHMLVAISASINQVGSGKIIIKMMQTISVARTRSLRLTTFCKNI